MALTEGGEDAPRPGHEDQTRAGAGARLGCGRTIDQVWDRIDQPADEHEKTCADCRAARVSLGRLRFATDRMRATTPEPPSRMIKDAVMAVARAEVRRGRKLSVRTTESGTIQISEQIVAGLVRGVADEFPGVHARRCSVALDDADDLGSLSADGALVIPESGVRQVRVTLGVAVALGAPIPAVLSQLRERVRERVETRLGVVTARIDVSVDDVFAVGADGESSVRDGSDSLGEAS